MDFDPRDDRVVLLREDEVCGGDLIEELVARSDEEGVLRPDARGDVVPDHLLAHIGR